MSTDAWLIGVVGAVWLALAALYAFVPAFHMPGSTLVWGAGAIGFIALAAMIASAERRNSSTASRHSTERSREP
ncbi:MAG: hypothetical protein JNK67_29750 [Alphaproteobacteria bacterium]|nr:hypothetical protein [Alphaproteobacteria bacterium]